MTHFHQYRSALLVYRGLTMISGVGAWPVTELAAKFSGEMIRSARNKLLRLRFGVAAVQERCRNSHLYLAKLHYKIRAAIFSAHQNWISRGGEMRSARTGGGTTQRLLNPQPLPVELAPEHMRVRGNGP
jgi:hypothetical protein